VGGLGAGANSKRKGARVWRPSKMVKIRSALDLSLGGEGREGGGNRIDGTVRRAKKGNVIEAD